MQIYVDKLHELKNEEKNIVIRSFFDIFSTFDGWGICKL